MNRLSIIAAIAATMLSSAVALAAPIGTSDNFEGDALGSFPAGWLDVSLVDTATPSPSAHPSAVVVDTTDAFGNPTKALATIDGIAPSQGIYRIVPLSSTYTSKADVRIDRYGDTVPGSSPTADWPMAVGVNKLQGTTDPAGIPSIQVYASSETQGWRLFISTDNVFADIDLGVAANVGTWYSVELDVDVFAATVRSVVADAATGTVLVDETDMLNNLPGYVGLWNPLVDGAFDIEGFFDGELTATTTAGLAVVDNIDQTVNPVPEPASLALLALGLGALGVRRRRRLG